MSLTKTQVYLESERLKILKTLAEQEHISVSRLIRQLVNQYTNLVKINNDKTPRKPLSIIGIGDSGPADVSENHDKYVGEAIAEQHNIC